MNGKIILNLAVSLDGYIADEGGGYDWIVGDGNPTLNTDERWDYGNFLGDIQVVVMGKNCYDQGFHQDFAGKEVYIATSKDLKDDGNYHFMNGDIVNQMDSIKKEGIYTKKAINIAFYSLRLHLPKNKIGFQIPYFLLRK